MSIEKITKDEIAAASVEESLPDRPSQTTLYGGKVMSPRELKKVYDKLPKLIAEKLNELIDKIGIEGEGSLAGDIPTGIRDGHTLADLFQDLPGGDAAYYLKVGEDTLADFCFTVKEGRLQFGEKAPTEKTKGANGGLYLVVKDGGIKEIYCYKDGNGWLQYKADNHYYIPSVKDGILSFTPTDKDMPTVPDIDTTFLPNLTASDEGKVLTAEGGAWVAKESKGQDVSQVTGDSETVAMSQKAVTKALGTVGSRIDQETKNVVSFVPSLWEEGTLTAGQNALAGAPRVRSVAYFTVKPSTIYRVAINDANFRVEINFYKSNNAFTRYVGWISSDSEFTTSATEEKIRVIISRIDNGSFDLAETVLRGVFLIQEKVEEKDPVQLILTSKTANLLNTSDTYTDYRITDDYPHFVVNSANAVISHPIFVGGKSKITLKSTAKQPYGARWLAFCTDRSRTGESVVSVNRGLGTSSSTEEKTLTLDVPNGAKWLYVTLKTDGGDSNWKNDTVAYGTEATDDAYEVGGVVGINDTMLALPESGDEADYAEVVKAETNRFNQVFVPYSVGTKTDTLSFSGQHERVNLLFMSDSHIDLVNPAESLQNVKDAVNFANRSKVKIDALLHGGDVITPFGRIAKDTAKATAKLFFDEAKRSKSPFIFAKGNHDINDWNNTPSNSFTDADWSEMWLDTAETKHGIVRQTKASGNKSTWHYYDIADKKIRVIAVDAQDTDKTTTDTSGNVEYYGGVAWYIAQEQMDWLINTALNFDDKDDKGWGVVVLIHQDVNYNTTLSPAYESAIKKFFDVCVAFNNQSTYQKTYTFADNSFFNLSVNADFTRYAGAENKPYIACWLLGHEHTDKHEEVDGITKIWIANNSASTDSSDQRLARVLGTATQNCFDVVNIDPVTKKVLCFRFGAGVTCYGNGGNRFLPDNDAQPTYWDGSYTDEDVVTEKGA